MQKYNLISSYFTPCGFIYCKVVNFCPPSSFLEGNEITESLQRSHFFHSPCFGPCCGVSRLLLQRTLSIGCFSHARIFILLQSIVHRRRCDYPYFRCKLAHFTRDDILRTNIPQLKSVERLKTDSSNYR